MEFKESEELYTKCDFCQSNLKKYTCPRCNAEYCSLICYQSANHLQCAETFYQKCVLEDIALVSNDNQSQQKTIEAISRIQNENNYAETKEEDSVLDSDDNDSTECLSLCDRLADVDLDDSAKVWEKLTDDERQQFKAFLRSGDISKFVPKWQPWWLQGCDAKIQEVEKITDYKENCPEIKKSIKQFETITKKAPAACVRFNLVNIICAYAFAVRYFNGCHFEFLEEAANCIVTLSLCLKTNKNFENIDSAVESVHQECVKTEWIVADMENINYMKEDTEAILKGPQNTDRKFYVLCGLSDLQKLIQLALKITRIQGSSKAPKFEGFKLQNDKLKLCLKKIEYFLSYTLCYFN